MWSKKRKESEDSQEYRLLLFSHLVMSDYLQPHGLQHTRLSCPSLSPRVCSNSCPMTRLGDAIQPSCPLLPASPLALNLSQQQGLSQWIGFLHQVVKVLELSLQPQSFQRIQVNSICPFIHSQMHWAPRACQALCWVLGWMQGWAR